MELCRNLAPVLPAGKEIPMFGATLQTTLRSDNTPEEELSDFAGRLNSSKPWASWACGLCQRGLAPHYYSTEAEFR